MAAATSLTTGGMIALGVRGAPLHRLHARLQATAGGRELAPQCRQMVGSAFHWPSLLPAYEQMYQQALAA